MDNSKIEKLSKSEKFLSKILESKLGKVFKLLLEGTPYVNALYNGIVEYIEKKNSITFFQEWIDKKLDDKLNGNNKNQVTLVTHAVLKSIRCSRDGQIRQIIAILKGTFDGNINSFDEAEDLINIVSELSQNEAIVLNKIYEYYVTPKNKLNTIQPTKKQEMFSEIRGNIIDPHKEIFEKEISKLLPQYGDSLKFYLGRLVGKGLLSVPMEKIDDIGDKKYQYTYMGKKLFESIY